MGCLNTSLTKPELSYQDIMQGPSSLSALLWLVYHVAA